MLILVSYDIADNRRRTKIANALQDFGRRVQWSVFECELTAEQVDRLRARVLGLIEKEEDSIRFYPLCGSCRQRVEVHGLGLEPGDPKMYIL